MVTKRSENAEFLKFYFSLSPAQREELEIYTIYNYASSVIGEDITPAHVNFGLASKITDMFSPDKLLKQFKNMALNSLLKKIIGDGENHQELREALIDGGGVVYAHLVHRLINKNGLNVDWPTKDAPQLSGREGKNFSESIAAIAEALENTSAPANALSKKLSCEDVSNDEDKLDQTTKRLSILFNMLKSYVEHSKRINLSPRIKNAVKAAADSLIAKKNAGVSAGLDFIKGLTGKDLKSKKDSTPVADISEEQLRNCKEAARALVEKHVNAYAKSYNKDPLKEDASELKELKEKVEKVEDGPFKGITSDDEDKRSAVIKEQGSERFEKFIAALKEVLEKEKDLKGKYENYKKTEEASKLDSDIKKLEERIKSLTELGKKTLTGNKTEDPKEEKKEESKAEQKEPEKDSSEDKTKIEKVSANFARATLTRMDYARKAKEAIIRAESSGKFYDQELARVAFSNYLRAKEAEEVCFSAAMESLTMSELELFKEVSRKAFSRNGVSQLYNFSDVDEDGDFYEDDIEDEEEDELEDDEIDDDEIDEDEDEDIDEEEEEEDADEDEEDEDVDIDDEDEDDEEENEEYDFGDEDEDEEDEDDEADIEDDEDEDEDSDDDIDYSFDDDEEEDEDEDSENFSLRLYDKGRRERRNYAGGIAKAVGAIAKTGAKIFGSSAAKAGASAAAKSGGKAISSGTLTSLRSALRSAGKTLSSKNLESLKELFGSIKSGDIKIKDLTQKFSGVKEMFSDPNKFKEFTNKFSPEVKNALNAARGKLASSNLTLGEITNLIKNEKVRSGVMQALRELIAKGLGDSAADGSAISAIFGGGSSSDKTSTNFSSSYKRLSDKQMFARIEEVNRQIRAYKNFCHQYEF